MDRDPYTGFDWAQNNLSVGTPHQLQDRGVQVYFAPNIPSDIKLVNLATGTLATYYPGEDRPPGNTFYAEYDSLRRYCEEHDMPFIETGGSVSVD
jgi:hypothetical protein